ncbi:MAG: hypothetical protein Q8Q23_02345 [bacterium]|nr:hypothetical protein [bacterium]
MKDIPNAIIFQRKQREELFNEKEFEFLFKKETTKVAVFKNLSKRLDSSILESKEQFFLAQKKSDFFIFADHFLLDCMAYIMTCFELKWLNKKEFDILKMRFEKEFLNNINYNYSLFFIRPSLRKVQENFTLNESTDFRFWEKKTKFLETSYKMFAKIYTEYSLENKKEWQIIKSDELKKQQDFIIKKNITNMNDKLSNTETVRKLFSKHSSKPADILLEAILNFFKRMPSNYVVQNLKDIEFICMNDECYKKYNISENNLKSILINFGNLEDLNISSITGLVAHLFALIDISYPEKANLSPQEWLEIDLYSDDVARRWGFEQEVNDLRKIRPQKIPCEIKYPDTVINTSVHNKKFESDILLLKNNSDDMHDRIWYVDRFSVLCELSNLRKKYIRNIHILTNNYREEDIKKI